MKKDWMPINVFSLLYIVGNNIQSTSYQHWKLLDFLVM